MLMDNPGNRDRLELLETQGHRAPLETQGLKDPRGPQVLMAPLDQTATPEQTETLEHRGPLVILVYKVLKVPPDQQDNQDQLVHQEMQGW